MQHLPQANILGLGEKERLFADSKTKKTASTEQKNR